MNILFICEYFIPFTPGGAEWSTFYLAKELVQNGHNVFVVTPNYGVKNFEEIDGIQVFRFPFPAKIKPGQHSISTAWLISPLFHLLFIRAILKFVKRNNIDILHAQNSSVLRTVVKASQLLKKPSFLTIRDTSLICPIGAMCLFYEDNVPLDCGFKRLFNKCINFYISNYVKKRLFSRFKSYASVAIQYYICERNKKLLKNLTGIIGVSKGILDVYKKAGIVGNVPLKVVYTLPPLSKKINEEEIELIKQELGLREEKVVLYIGKQSIGKGIHIFFEAISKVIKRVDNTVMFIIAGKSDRNWELNQAYTNVKFLGSIPHEKVLAIYAIADIVVLPSIWPEPLSRVLLESAFFEIPCIGTNTGGTPEVIVDRVTGILIEKNNSSLLAKAIVDLIKDDKRRLQMGKRAKEYVLKNFNAQEIINSLLSFYKGMEETPAPLVGKVSNIKYNIE